MSPLDETCSPRRMANNSSSTILDKEQKLTPGLFSSWVETYSSCFAKNSSVGKEKSAIYIDPAIAANLCEEAGSDFLVFFSDLRVSTGSFNLKRVSR